MYKKVGVRIHYTLFCDCLLFYSFFDWCFNLIHCLNTYARVRIVVEAYWKQKVYFNGGAFTFIRKIKRELLGCLLNLFATDAFRKVGSFFFSTLGAEGNENSYNIFLCNLLQKKNKKKN